MIYRADEYRIADIQEQMALKLDRLWSVVNAYACSPSVPTENDMCAILEFVEVAQEQFAECQKAIAGASDALCGRGSFVYGQVPSRARKAVRGSLWHLKQAWTSR